MHWNLLYEEVTKLVAAHKQRKTQTHNTKLINEMRIMKVLMKLGRTINVCKDCLYCEYKIEERQKLLGCEESK